MISGYNGMEIEGIKKLKDSKIEYFVLWGRRQNPRHLPIKFAMKFQAIL